MEHLFIINPAAGKYDQTQAFSQAIHQVCTRNGLNYRIECSNMRGDCARIARQAADSGREYHIYACGGDGTLNEVVSGCVGFSNVAITHFPGGSGNDFIKVFSHPDAFQDLDRLLDYGERSFDIIDCNGHYALNVCSVGLDARIGTQIADYKRLPLVTGSGSYILSTLVNVIKGVSEHFIIDINGEHIDADQTMICIANGRCYGGSFYAVPDADPCDGLLDVLLVKKVSRLQVARLVRTYQKGQYQTLPLLIRHIKTNALRIMCQSDTSINLDGELQHGKILDIRLRQNQIRFFYPKGLTVQPALSPVP